MKEMYDTNGMVHLIMTPEEFCESVFYKVSAAEPIIVSQIGSAQTESNTPFDPEAEITNIFRQIGIPANIKGYCFARSAIMMVINDSSAINAVIKKIYPSIAREYNTTPHRAERAIRYAIESAFIRGNIDLLDELFPSSCGKSKVPNSEFIATIADNIQLGRRGEG